VALLTALNVPAELEILGYHNLRCDWIASTCDSSYAPPGSLENSVNAILEAYDDHVVSDAALPRTFAALFGGIDKSAAVTLGWSDAVRAQCCAQFVVARKHLAALAGRVPRITAVAA